MKSKIFVGFFLILLVVVIAMQFWDFTKSGKNWRNCQKVRIFMSEKQVLDIIGPPDSKYDKLKYENISFWVYDAGVAAADGISLAIDEEHDQVININCNGTIVRETIKGDTVPADYLSRWKAPRKQKLNNQKK